MLQYPPDLVGYGRDPPILNGLTARVLLCNLSSTTKKVEKIADYMEMLLPKLFYQKLLAQNRLLERAT